MIFRTDNPQSDGSYFIKHQFHTGGLEGKGIAHWKDNQWWSIISTDKGKNVPFNHDGYEVIAWLDEN